jgi:hypothetical protein
MCVTSYAFGVRYVENNPQNAPDSWRDGAWQWAYGWLANQHGYWPAGDTDAITLYSKQQWFWRRW